ncbi:carbohydrate binding module (family 6) [Paenibacillus algicola]|uniref:glucan endo-1,3-beta-D-glucosidase n=1 Tax=Paenibacillus algicola TaxID=2565926 RepID=A0A4V1G438_9BACL|nr:glycosyl hydrolase [Paenibacillus algicola]QCT03344.1 carbohydrate binding module (family 6) [Paenibacillus algicola]
MRNKFWYKTALSSVLAMAAAAFSAAPSSVHAAGIMSGSGSYSAGTPAEAMPLQAEQYITEDLLNKPVPTNQWWSSLLWDSFSEAQYPHPLAVRHEPQGLRIYHPGPHLLQEPTVIDGTMAVDGDFIAGHTGESQFPEARVAGYSDWFVDAQYESGQHEMKVSYGHGSPFTYFTYAGGNPKLIFQETPELWYGGRSSSVLGITVNGSHYGLFGPTGSTWIGLDRQEWVNQLNGKDYFSIAVLPDNRPATLEKFQQYAYSHITDTKVSWTYDEEQSEVTSTYRFTTEPKEGLRSGTLFTMYPHQWKYTDTDPLPYRYASVRGDLATGEGDRFTTVMKYHGILPALPAVGEDQLSSMKALLEEARNEPETGAADSYSAAKELGRLTALLPLAKDSGESEAAVFFEQKLQGMLEDWLTYTDEDRDQLFYPSSYFYYDFAWSTLIGYPASLGSDSELNDHHIVNGYFIKAAAELARHNPEWASDSSYGGMVDLLIRDMASPDRQDALFPFLRVFDPYAGHSWSSGAARYGSGNYNAASGEVMNAWSSLILWGEATRDPAIRNLGIYLYTTEMQAILQYWLDADQTHFHDDFTPAGAAAIWGGKTEGDSTLWSTRPAEVQAANWLPFSGSSLYLTASPSLAERHFTKLRQDEQDTRDEEGLRDLVYMYQAISQPEEALKAFENTAPLFAAQAGSSKAHAYAWISMLNERGTQNKDITADTPLYAVYKHPEHGSTYVVYNMSSSPVNVTFSDGTTMTASPSGFTEKTLP